MKDGNGKKPEGLTRRSFLQCSAFVGGSALLVQQVERAVGLLGTAEAGYLTPVEQYELAKAENIINTVCLQCHVACPVKAKFLNGVLQKLDGPAYSSQNMQPHIAYHVSPEEAARIDTTICSKSQSGVQTYYDPYRLRKILKRNGPRGSNRWKTIPFEQAVEEIVNGGNLFGEGPVPGLKEVLALRDPKLSKSLAGDVGKVQKHKMTVAEFKQKHAANLDLLIDPDHPDLGPKYNQFAFAAGRAEHGRKEIFKRFTNNIFCTPNYLDHYNICEPSHHFAFEVASNQYKKGKWQKGKHHLKIDLMNVDFVLYFGTGAFEANFGSTPMAGKLTRSLVHRGTRMAVADPRLSKTAAKADWWLPIKPGGDAALALGMMRWIFEHERYNTAYLENANKAAAAEDREPNWTSATYLVKIEEGRATRFLRASEVGLGSEHQFVISREGQLVAVTPEDKATPLHGDLFAEVTAQGIQAKASLLLLRERAYEKGLAEYAELSGIDVRHIKEVSREFTSHGRKAAADFYRGPCQHTNGYYNSLAIVLLNWLIGNVDWKGGMSKGGSHWHEFGGKPGNVYHFKKLFNEKLTKFGVTNTRAGTQYEDTTLFAKDGYPAKRPWYPYIGSMYSEIAPSAADKYPYPLKILFHHKGTLALATPGGTQETIDTLRDPSQIPLFVSFDIVIGETSMYADYIIPDLTYLERWGTPHVTPDVQTTTSKVRQPAAVPLTETVTVDGEQMPISTEAFLIAAAKAMGLPGVGKDGFGPGMDFHRPEDFYLKAVANIAFGDKKGHVVPDASPEEMALFRKARRHLPKTVFDEEKWRRAVRPHEWAKVVYVLNRGGRYESFDKYAQSGRLVPHKFGKMLNFFIEEIAESKSSMTGEHFDGLTLYEPVKDAKGRVVSDTDFPFRLITYKEIFGGHSRTAGNYWSNIALQPGNKVLINRSDAARLGLQDGDRVRLTSKTNPTGEVDLRDGTKTKVEGEVKLIEGIRPGVVAVSWHYGHWNAYGASDKIVVDGTRIKPDPRRGTGLCSNLVNRVDESVGRAGLTDPIGGSVSFYDTDVKVIRV